LDLTDKRIQSTRISSKNRNQYKARLSSGEVLFNNINETKISRLQRCKNLTKQYTTINI